MNALKSIFEKPCSQSIYTVKHQFCSEVNSWHQTSKLELWIDATAIMGPPSNVLEKRCVRTWGWGGGRCLERKVRERERGCSKRERQTGKKETPADTHRERKTQKDKETFTQPHSHISATQTNLLAVYCKLLYPEYTKTKSKTKTNMILVTFQWLWLVSDACSSASTQSIHIYSPSVKNHIINLPKDSDVGLEDRHNHITVKASILDDVAHRFLKPLHISKHLRTNDVTGWGQAGMVGQMMWQDEARLEW